MTIKNRHFPRILSRFILPPLEKLRGTDIQKQLRFLEESQWWPKERMEDYQNKKLSELVTHAYQQVPYYRELFDGLHLRPGDIRTRDDLDKLPILEKIQIRANPESFIASNKRRGAKKNSTSGSTGTPMTFFYDNESLSKTWASAIRSWTRTGYSMGDPMMRVAMADPNSFDTRIKHALLNCEYHYAGDLDVGKLTEMADSIESYHNLFIHGFTSPLNVLTNFILEHNINITTNITGISTTSDNLLPDARKKMEKAFSTKVLDSYGAGGEHLSIAHQCEVTGAYHVDEESVILELLEGNLEQSKRIIVTGLDTYTMPLLRYAIGDLATPYGGTCPCGRETMLLSSIDGRDADVIKTLSGKKLPVQLLMRLFMHKDGIDQWQIVQDTPDHAFIKLVTSDGFKPEYEKMILKDFSSQAGEGMYADISYVNTIAPRLSGKAQLVISQI